MATNRDDPNPVPHLIERGAARLSGLDTLLTSQRERHVHPALIDILTSSSTPLKSSIHNILRLLLSLCARATTWLYVHHISSPDGADAKDLQKGGLKAQMGDLYPRWVGARERLRARTKSLQHGSQPGNSDGLLRTHCHAGRSRQHVVDEQRFAYPIYVILLMAPTINTGVCESALLGAVCTGCVCCRKCHLLVI